MKNSYRQTDLDISLIDCRVSITDIMWQTVDNNQLPLQLKLVSFVKLPVNMYVKVVYN